MKKIFIIGHAGYIGPILVKLLKDKYFICGVDTNWFKQKVIYKDNIEDYQPHKVIIEDLRNLSLKNLGFIPDAVIYLAAISNDPMGNNFSKITKQINTVYLQKIAKQAKLLGVKSLFLRCCSIYGAAGNSKKRESQITTSYRLCKI